MGAEGNSPSPANWCPASSQARGINIGMTASRQMPPRMRSNILQQVAAIFGFVTRREMRDPGAHSANRNRGDVRGCHGYWIQESPVVEWIAWARLRDFRWLFPMIRP